MQSSSYDADTDNASNALWSSTYSYDGLGRLGKVYIADGRVRTVSFANNGEGQVLLRKETSASALNPEDRHYYLGGVQLGELTNNGNNDPKYGGYEQSITTRGWNNNGQSEPFRYNTNGPVTGAHFGSGGFSAINAYGAGMAGRDSSYIVRAGDSLGSIAAALWGDASLWYKLAEANGLTAQSSLSAGQSLLVPDKVMRQGYNASSFTPYDAGHALGDLAPTANPKPPKVNNDCGGLGAILLAVIAVAVTIVSQGTLTGIAAGIVGKGAGATILGGALAGAAGSIVSQGVGLATGIQDRFNWGAVGLGAIGGAVGGGLGELGKIAGSAKGLLGVLGKAGGFLAKGSFVSNVARGLVSSALTQGIGVATGLQDRFDWTGVAAGGLVSGVGGAVARGLASDKGLLGVRITGTFGNEFVSGMAGGIAGAATRSVIDGTDFGDNLIAALPDVIASTVGSAIGRSINGSIDKARAARAARTEALLDPDGSRRAARQAQANAELGKLPTIPGLGAVATPAPNVNATRSDAGAADGDEIIVLGSRTVTPSEQDSLDFSGLRARLAERRAVRAALLNGDILVDPFPDITAKLADIESRLARPVAHIPKKRFEALHMKEMRRLDAEHRRMLREQQAASDRATTDDGEIIVRAKRQKPPMPAEVKDTLRISVLDQWEAEYRAAWKASKGKYDRGDYERVLQNYAERRKYLAELSSMATANVNRTFGGLALIGPLGGAALAGGVFLAPYAPLALSSAQEGLVIAGSTVARVTGTAVAGLGYTGTANTIAGSMVLKGAVGLGFEVAGNSLSGEQMTFGKGLGAASAAIVFGPGAEKALGISAATPWGWSAAGKFMVSGGAAGFGGNLTQQGVDWRTGASSSFSVGDLTSSTLWGAAAGPLAGGVQRIYTPSFIRTTGNSLVEDLFGAPKTVTEGVGTILQKQLTRPRPGQ